MPKGQQQRHEAVVEEMRGLVPGCRQGNSGPGIGTKENHRGHEKGGCDAGAADPAVCCHCGGTVATEVEQEFYLQAFRATKLSGNSSLDGEGLGFHLGLSSLDHPQPLPGESFGFPGWRNRR